jgi:hypothetical protein
MWKVKRMNTARIVVPAIAIGAGGIAAFLASGSDSPPQPAQRVVQLPTVDLRVLAIDHGAPEISTGDQQRSRRGETINVVRYGINSPTTMQK